MCYCPFCRHLSVGAKGEPSQLVTAPNGFFIRFFQLALRFSSLSPPLLPPLPLFPVFPSSHSLPCYPLMYFLGLFPGGTGKWVICLKDRRTGPADCCKLWHKPRLPSRGDMFLSHYAPSKKFTVFILWKEQCQSLSDFHSRN